jgi:release factor glutamine methyltransferase
VKVGPALQEATDRLAAAGIESPRREARVLLRLAAGPSAGAALDPEATLTPASVARLRDFVGRRCRFEPVAYLRGTQEFRSLEFTVSPAVLIPRPETESLVDEALAFLPPSGAQSRVADFGTGSGCIAIALAVACPSVEVWAMDRSPAALDVAARNAVRHGVEARVHVVTGCFRRPGLPEFLRGRLDAVLCNPPYVERSERFTLPPDVRLWEPLSALIAEDGVQTVYGDVGLGARPWLRAGGMLALEVGYGQAPAVAGWMRSLGYRGVCVRRDYAGVERLVLAYAAEEAGR